MPKAVCSDLFLQQVGTFINGQLNGPTFLRLFQNPVTITPATVVADLIESNFNGYFSILVGGTFIGPSKLGSGLWVSRSKLVGWTATMNNAQRVYGAYLTNPTSLIFGANFAHPLPVVAGGQLSVRVEVQDWDLSIALGP